MIGRIVWIASLLGVAAVTAGLQLDRQSQAAPALAPLVPAPFRNYAQTQLTIAAIDASSSQAALAEAQRLVRRRPVPAEYLTLLAAAQTKAGETQKAGLTIQIAGQRGWREPLAQEAVLRLALEAGDKAEAARRYGALLRREATPDALLLELGSAVFSEPRGAGRQSLTDVIVGAERWHTLFLQRGLRVMPTDAFSEVAAAAMERGARFDCELLKRTIEGLRQRDPAAAEKLATAAKACG